MLSPYNPPSGYRDRYHKLIQSRGFLVASDSGSPHQFPPQVWGYQFKVFKKGRTTPYTLLYRQFVDMDERWTKSKASGHFPSPYSLEGHRLSVRLSPDALAAWRETTLIPDADQAILGELPFGRFPGSYLLRGGVEGRDIFAEYVALGVSLETIVEHYEMALRAYGFPVMRISGQGPNVKWAGEEGPRGTKGIKGISYVRVEGANIVPLPGSGLELQKLKEMAPDLLADFPKEVQAISVLVTFIDAVDAQAYGGGTSRKGAKQ